MGAGKNRTQGHLRVAAPGPEWQPPRPSDPAEAAQYIADMTLELRNLAKSAELPFLAYLLEMAFTEALDRSRPDA